MKENKICSFFGHAEIEITCELIKRLREKVLELIEKGFSVFYFGGFGKFDDFCYEIVSDIKVEKPELNIQRVYCVPQENLLSKINKYKKSWGEFEDYIFLTPTFYGWYKSIYFRNCAMIDASDFIIFYAEKRENSGAYKAYRYALSKKKELVNLYK